MVVAGRAIMRCAITSLGESSGSPLLDGNRQRREQLRTCLRQWVVDGVELVQLREKALGARELAGLCHLAAGLVRQPDGKGTRLLVNGRPDVAAAAGADGVHLTARAGELSPGEVRRLFRQAGRTECLVSVSCHTPGEVVAAREHGADLILFGPVFEKRVDGERIRGGTGLDRLREVVQLAGGVRVLALGGVTAENAVQCIAAGAAGVAGIRLFAGERPRESL